MKQKRYLNELLLRNATAATQNISAVFQDFNAVSSLPIPRCLKDRFTTSITFGNIQHFTCHQLLETADGVAIMQQLLSITRFNMEVLYNESLFNSGWQDEVKWSELTQENSQYFVVFDVRNEAKPCDVISFIQFRFELDTDNVIPGVVCYIWELQTHAKCQSLGIGKRLMDLTELLSRHFCINKMMCTALKSNERALRFYKLKCGFVIDESNPDNFISLNSDSLESSYEILKKQLV